MPFGSRFMQNLRIFHDTHKRIPALPNALKYSTSMLVVLFGEMHPAIVAAVEEKNLLLVHVAWVAVYLCAAGARCLDLSPGRSPAAATVSPRLPALWPRGGRQPRLTRSLSVSCVRVCVRACVCACVRARVCVASVSTLYTFAWDVIMDWKLGHSKEGGLRPRRMFPQRWVYYVAIVVDLVLRFGWTATLVPHWLALANLGETVEERAER
jgi:hypothetical protein